MNLVGDTIYKSTSNLPIEDYLYQLERNCDSANYSFKILRKNPWRCSLELIPWKELRLERNSFKQTIFIEIEIYEDKLDIRTTCRSPRITLPFLIGFGMWILLLIAVMIYVKTPGPIGLLLYLGGGCILMGIVLHRIMNSAKKTLEQLTPKDNKVYVSEKR